MPDSRGRWAAFLADMTTRPGWTQLRLARESGIHRTTITRWLAGKGGLTIDSVRKVAKALDVDMRVAMAAAGDLVEDTEQDPTIRMIRDAALPPEVERELIDYVRERILADERRRYAEIQRMIRWRRGA